MADWGTAVQLGVGAVSEILSGMSEAKQQELLERAYREFGSISLPNLQKIMAEEAGPSAMEGVHGDAGAAAIERQALDEIMRVARGGGRTLEDDANLADLQSKLARQRQAGQQRIQEDMSARGIAGGGSELALRRANAQDAANRASSEGLRLNADRESRALQAMMEGGRLGGSINRNAFSQNAQKADAIDRRAQYNADARQRAAMYNAGLGQTQFENRLRLASGKTQQLGNQSGFYGQQAADRRALGAGIGKAGYEAAKSSRYDDEEDF